MLTALAAAVVLAASEPPLPPNKDCPRSPAPPSDELPKLRDVYSTCNFRLGSPNGKLVLQIDTVGNVRVLPQHGRPELVSRVEPPAIAGWSPTSRALLINDGEGSGQSSTLRVYVRIGARFVERPQFGARAEALYRKWFACHDRSKTYRLGPAYYMSEQPYVWGLGWSPDGKRMYLKITDGTHDRDCSYPADAIGAELDMATGQVLSVYGEAEAKRRLRGYWPTR